MKKKLLTVRICVILLVAASSGLYRSLPSISLHLEIIEVTLSVGSGLFFAFVWKHLDFPTFRKYAPNVELKPTNSRNQFTGLKNNATYQNGSVYVNTYFPCPSPVHCRNACTAGIMAPDCTTWTWEPKYGGYGAICALNVYTPIRRLNITMRITKPVLISGCIGADATLCPNLPDH